jgi:hypothetical protein
MLSNSLSQGTTTKLDSGTTIGANKPEARSEQELRRPSMLQTSNQVPKAISGILVCLVVFLILVGGMAPSKYMVCQTRALQCGEL